MNNVENKPESERRCVGCGAELPAQAPQGLCPKCLLKLAMETQPETAPAEAAVNPGGEGASRGLPQPGEQFGSYAIVRLLGAGGMGAVYEAQDLESGRRIALKVLSQRLDSPEARERFFREGRLAASINHPNSVYIFGTEEIGGTPIITMELMANGTLQDRVRAQGPLPIGEAVDCALQIISGLEAAQQIGILHRDVKPSNCYVGEDGIVKIGDFGLSISTAVRTEPALTTTGAFLGTPAFCSPEQMRGEELNMRSDMYSVGATLFYLLTGRTPFEAQNMVQLLATVLEQRPPSPRESRAEVPKGLAKAVLRCLEKQPAERFKSYADLATTLAPYSSTAPTPATLSLRFVAGILDMILLCGLAAAVNLSVFGTPMAFFDQAMQRAPKVLLCALAGLGLAVVYFAVCEGLWGAALGKAICRLRVVGFNRNAPGFPRASLRTLVFVVPPLIPYWLTFGTNPKAYLTGSQLMQYLLGFSVYAGVALLFVTARRRNGFAAVQDLLSGTRVVSRAALTPRPRLESIEPQPTAESAVTIGPYHVLQALSQSGEDKWFLAYDLRLLRKVWIRTSSPGKPPVPARLRALGRPGRLRWLTGKRSPEENWDAFEALNGRPIVELISSPQPWGKVRYWLHDLAAEISAADQDGTRPELALDRVWLTAEGRAKLLDFPAPGVATAPPELPQPWNVFLNTLAASALVGARNSSQPAGEVAVALPLHARAFLRSLARMTGAEAVAVALKPLLGRVAAVSRLRRAALVGGCIAFPVLTWAGGFFAFGFMRELTHRNPGLMELNSLLQMRSSARFWGGHKLPMPSDQQMAVYIAHHYRGLITNANSWSNPMVIGMIKGESRKFAEQSVAEHPAPTEEQIAEADAAVERYVPKQQFFYENPPRGLPAMVFSSSLLVYVGLPALAAALLFRGGLVLLIAGVTYTRKNGILASRPRLLWRSILTWGPVLPVFAVTILGLVKHLAWQPWLALALLGLLAACSVALPRRGLQDRLAGTWPVPR